MYAMTNEKGMAGAFPDVCKTPAPPVGEVPIPYQNLAMMQNAKGDTCAQKVYILGAKALTMKTVIAQSVGDEPGVGEGVISETVQGPAGFTTGSIKVYVEGSQGIYQGSMTKQNGDNPNCVGAVNNPSQTKVVWVE